jgi:hypothetical protein
MNRIRAIKVACEKIAVGDLIHWRGATQRVLSIEEGQGMPWPAEVKWRALHLDRPSGPIQYGYSSTVVFETMANIVKIEVIPCALSVSKG